MKDKNLKICFAVMVIVTIIGNIACWYLHSQMECKDEHVYVLHEDWT